MSCEIEKNKYKSIIENFYVHEKRHEKNYMGKDSNGNKVILSDLLNDTTQQIIFKYKLTDCSDCINKVFERLEKLNNNYVIIIISTFRSFTEMKCLKKKLPQKKIFFLQVEHIEESDITPCIYQLNQQFEIYNFLNIFVDDQVLPGYIQCLNKKQLKQDNKKII